MRLRCKRKPVGHTPGPHAGRRVRILIPGRWGEGGAGARGGISHLCLITGSLVWSSRISPQTPSSDTLEFSFLTERSRPQTQGPHPGRLCHTRAVWLLGGRPASPHRAPPAAATRRGQGRRRAEPREGAEDSEPPRRQAGATGGAPGHRGHPRRHPLLVSPRPGQNLLGSPSAQPRAPKSDARCSC